MDVLHDVVDILGVRAPRHVKAISVKGICSLAAEGLQPQGTWNRRVGEPRQWNLCTGALHRPAPPACHLSPVRLKARLAKVMFMGLGGAERGRPCSPSTGALNSPAGGQVQVWMCERPGGPRSSCRQQQGAPGRSRMFSEHRERSRAFAKFASSREVREHRERSGGTFQNMLEYDRSPYC